MHKFIKIKMRDKTSITMPIEQAEAVLASPQQLMMIFDIDGNWTGQSINKAEIVGTDRDYDEERQFNENVKALGNGREKDVLEIKELLRKYKPKFLQ